eukprot:5061642-Amphidinium_carterae.1
MEKIGLASKSCPVHGKQDNCLDVNQEWSHRDKASVVATSIKSTCDMDVMNSICWNGTVK